WEILRFHVREFDEPGRKIEQAQAMAKFLAAGTPRGEDYSEFLHKELEALAERKHANVLYHDDLSEVNDPVYFHEFAARAAAHGLQYLAEADFFEMQDRIYPPQVREVLRGLGERDIILKEQYLDFLKLRRFRQTLLCHQGVPLDRDLKPARAREFRVLSAARATSPQPNLAAGAVEEFAGPRGGAMKLDHPLSKAALLVLADVFPHSLTYPELLARARQRLDADAAARESLKDSDPERDEEILTEVLLATYLADVTRWQVYQPEWPMALGEKPRLSPVARLELENGESVVTTLNFGVVSVEEAFDRQVLLLADGSRSPDDIAGEMGAKVRAGEVRVPAVAGEGGAPVTPEVPEAVRRSLEKAARYGLFAA
ncbi:MAG TPA: methyltransferase regulatory domain-containing protein, partial [Gemmataceae bacterium]